MLSAPADPPTMSPDDTGLTKSAGDFTLRAWMLTVSKSEEGLAIRVLDRFGQFLSIFDKIRTLIEHRPVEKTAIELVLNSPGDFDVAQNSCHADDDSFFHRSTAP
jgi:hypothetical protein